MAEQNEIMRAKETYETLCAAIENRGWTFDRHVDKLVIDFTVSGEDIPMDFVVIVDEKRQLIRLVSLLPFTVPEDKRVAGAVMACAASYGLADGNFDFDMADGRMYFRQTASFRGGRVGEGLFHRMISVACSTVDRYNDSMLRVCKGMLSLEDFLSKV